MERNQVKIGQRVEIIDGLLKGERATIIDPGDGQYIDGDWVWIKFDRDEAHLGPEQGYAILSAGWYEIDRLKPING
jgi:hypothetical protein